MTEPRTIEAGVARPSGSARLQPIRGERAAERLGRLIRRHALALLLVGLPTLLTATYFGLIASDIYHSEARFIMRAAGGPPAAGLANLVLPVEVGGLGRANDEAHVVNAFLVSRDAMQRLIDSDDLLAAVSRPEADVVARFPRPWDTPSRERLFRRFDGFVSVAYDTQTGISTLTVRAFRADDARRLAAALLVYAEQLVNRLNERARSDMISFASGVVTQTEARVVAAQNLLSQFRNAEMIFDPAQQSVSALELVATLSTELAQLRARLAETRSSAPDSPRVGALVNRIHAIEQQIAEQRAAIAGGDGSLASKVASYERLVLERELATKALTAALASLETARQEAQRQHLYLERIVEPNTPDHPAGPQRILSVLTVLAIALAVHVIVSTLIAWTWEHEP